MRRAAACLAAGLLLAACLAAGLLLAACGGGGGPKPTTQTTTTRTTPPPRATATPVASDAEQLRALLRRRAAALQRRDAAAYAATATGAQRRRDRIVAARARALPLRDVALTVRRSEIEGDRASLSVDSSYRVAGVASRYTARRRVTALKTPDGWLVRSEASRRERHPWELGRFVLTRTDHLRILAPAGIDAAGAAMTLERSWRRVQAAVPTARLPRRLLTVIAADATQARTLTERIQGVERLAAITDAAVRDTGPAERVTAIVSLRLLVVWPRFEALDPAGRLRVATHELTHAALTRQTSGRTPAWLVEGVALYASRDRRTATAARLVQDPPGARAARRGLSLAALSRPDAIARLPGDGLSAAYAYSSAAAYYVVARFGERRLLRLYDAFNDADVAGARGAAVADAALRATVDLSLRRFERDLRRWLRRTG